MGFSSSKVFLRPEGCVWGIWQGAGRSGSGGKGQQSPQPVGPCKKEAKTQSSWQIKVPLLSRAMWGKWEETNNWVNRLWSNMERLAVCLQRLETCGALGNSACGYGGWRWVCCLYAPSPGVEYPRPAIFCFPSWLSEALVAISRRELGKKRIWKSFGTRNACNFNLVLYPPIEP